MQHSTLKRAYFLISMYISIVHDHLCDTQLPTFETLSFFAYWVTKIIYSILLAQQVVWLPKLAIYLSFLVFHVCALFLELFGEIVKQSTYTSHNITDFVHHWFWEKLDEKFAISSTLTFRENTDRLARMAKCEMRKMIGDGLRNVIYTLLISFLSSTFFRILVNFTINV